MPIAPFFMYSGIMYALHYCPARLAFFQNIFVDDFGNLVQTDHILVSR